MTEFTKGTPITKRSYGLIIKKEDPSSLKYLIFTEENSHHPTPLLASPVPPKPTPLPTPPVPPKPTPLPTIVDLRPKMPPICDQGSLGSCTANALCGLIGYENPNMIKGSRLFLYYNERVIEKDVPIDAGATLADGILSLQTYGICPETSWPYIISNFAVKPPAQCYTQALAHKATQVQNIQNTLSQMKAALNAGYPFVVGILVYQSFESAAVASTGLVPMPNLQKEQLLGGHAVVCVGYNDTKQLWIMRNSWGTSWGDKGYFYLPYNYLLNSVLTSDLWCIQKIN